MLHADRSSRNRCFRFLGNALLAAAAVAHANANVLTVTTTIQAAVDAAHPGGTVRVPAGIYHENILVNKNGITIEGLIGAILDGKGSSGDTGITVAPAGSSAVINGFWLHGMQIRNYSQNGVLLEHVQGFQLSGGVYTNNNQYGLFPVLSSQGTVELNRVSGSNDTGIYVARARCNLRGLGYARLESIIVRIPA
jgi:nitrous oxidase accessory protein NosD